MSFGLNKCATASVVRGKLTDSSNIALPCRRCYIKALEFHKYLGVFVIKDSSGHHQLQNESEDNPEFCP